LSRIGRGGSRRRRMVANGGTAGRMRGPVKSSQHSTEAERTLSTCRVRSSPRWIAVTPRCRSRRRPFRRAAGMTSAAPCGGGGRRLTMPARELPGRLDPDSGAGTSHQHGRSLYRMRWRRWRNKSHEDSPVATLRDAAARAEPRRRRLTAGLLGLSAGAVSVAIVASLLGSLGSQDARPAPDRGTTAGIVPPGTVTPPGDAVPEGRLVLQLNSGIEVLAHEIARASPWAVTRSSRTTSLPTQATSLQRRT
jgi:hypothetical protein